jgi:hypothetical protein
VNLVNLDGLTIIGPGSEWFWSAASGIVLAVTFLAIYRQLRVQSAAAAVAQIEAMTAPSEKLLRHGLVLLEAFKANPIIRTPLPEGAAAWVENHFERQATLARKGFMNVDLLLDLDSSNWQTWWWLLEPDVRMSRERSGDPHVLENFEWLARAATEFDRRRGQQPPSEEYILGSLDRWTSWFEDQIRVEVEVRSDVMPQRLPADHADSPTDVVVRGARVDSPALSEA